MQYWDDFVTREDLESEPGVVDMDKVRALSLNTYLRYVEDFIELGGNDIPSVATEQVENFMVDDFMSYTHAMEGRYPDPEEIHAHLRKPENVAARQYWIWICLHATKENWPAFVKLIREDWEIPEHVEVKNEEERIRKMEKLLRERTWTSREIGS